jgi:hypothetical protein
MNKLAFGLLLLSMTTSQGVFDTIFDNHLSSKSRRRLAEDPGCVAKAKADYSTCYGKALSYPSGNNRDAAVQLCDEILDNDTADCRKLVSQSDRHLVAYPECVSKSTADFSDCHVKSLYKKTKDARAEALRECTDALYFGRKKCEEDNVRRLQGDQDCVSKSKSDYNLCFGKALNYPSGNNRDAAVQLCDEILDNDTADCRKLSKSGTKHLEEGYTECHTHGLKVLEECEVQSSHQNSIKEHQHAYLACLEAFDDSEKDCRSKYPRRLQVVASNLCTVQAKTEYDSCLGSASQASSQSQKDIVSQYCLRTYNIALSDCGAPPAIPSGPIVGGGASTLPPTRSSPLPPTQSPTPPQSGQNTPLDANPLSYQYLTRDEPVNLPNNFCVKNIRNTYFTCMQNAYAVSDESSKQNRIGSCRIVRNRGFNQCLLQAGLPILGTRLLGQTKVQCLKIANENYVKCQLEISKLPEWTGEDLAGRASATVKCRGEFDRDQDECEGKPSSYESPIRKPVVVAAKVTA